MGVKQDTGDAQGLGQEGEHPELDNSSILIMGAAQNKRDVLILSLSGVPGTGASPPHFSALKRLVEGIISTRKKEKGLRAMT